MLTVTADISSSVAALAGMVQKINHFKAVDIGAELSAWQTEDMHRQRPFTMRSRRAGRATTKIRPHSLYRVQRSALAQRRVARRRKSKRAAYAVTLDYLRRWSTRPILREELYQRLEQRMGDALGKLLTWT